MAAHFWRPATMILLALIASAVAVLTVGHGGRSIAAGQATRTLSAQPVAATHGDHARAGDVIMPPAFLQPPRPGEVRYPSARIRFVQATGTESAARVSARTAEESFLQSHVRSELAGMPRSVILSRFSDDGFGPEGADGIVHPVFQDVLAWVVTVRDAPVAVHRVREGGPRLPAACDFVFVVNAVTGEAMTAFQACGKTVG